MLITDAERLERFHARQRRWQGIPSMERTAKGRLFSTFYSGGTGEQWGNYCVVLTSGDDGLTWSEPIAAAYAGEDARCYDPNLWIDPLGRLWFFWAAMPVCGVYAVVCEQPDEARLEWSAPVRVGEGVMMNKPTVLSNGDWLLPVAVWRRGVCVLKPMRSPWPGLSYAVRSADRGKSFERLGGADVPRRSFDEHMILERGDGSLLMAVRTKPGIGKSESFDGGRTWTPGADAWHPGPCSRFFLRRLASGRVLLVNHHDFTGRNNLTAFLSEDEGETWGGGLLLDGRDDVSYPDGTQSPDGFLYVTYDRERYGAKDILFAKFTEEDICAGKLVSAGSRLACVVSKLGEES